MLSGRATLHILLSFLLLAGCDRTPNDRIQGYVEGEFVYVASPLAGQLEKLSVDRGAQVKPNDDLFTLEHASEQASLDAAQKRVAQAKAALEFSEKELKRQQDLSGSAAVSQQDLDRAISNRDQDTSRLAESQAQLVRAQWDLSQKHQAATQASLVFDTLFRQGEWVPAGRPVVSLLPPANIKVRAFVPEPRIGSIKLNQVAQVYIDGIATPIDGRVTFISPQAEYTPPVIYSQESRNKLVFLIEINFDDKNAVSLHPGQPVDVTFESTNEHQEK